MKIYQTTVFIGVMFAMIYYDMTGDGYAGPVVAAIIAYLVTVIPLKIYDWSMRLKWFIERRISRNPLPSDSTTSNHSEALLGDVLRPYLDAKRPQRSQDSLYGPE